MARDEIYQQFRQTVKDFVFDADVAEVFDDMIGRSVPHYLEVQRISAQLAAKFYQDQTAIVDLGCSTGNTLIAIRANLACRPFALIGVDNSAAMLDRCESKLQLAGIREEVRLINADITTYNPERSSVVTMNYTLQFVEPSARQEVLSRIYRALTPGGVLLLTEKILHQPMPLEDVMRELYYDFKRNNLYSELEIAQKRDALEQVLKPIPIAETMEILAQAGFDLIEIGLKWFHFTTFVALKT